jgi:ubiquinone biosynthesis protein
VQIGTMCSENRLKLQDFVASRCRARVGSSVMNLARIAEISRVFLEEGLGLTTPSIPVPAATGGSTPDVVSSDTERAARLRRALTRLGPTFVKFGQLLATRVDLFSEDFLRELRKLRCHVPPFSVAEARRIVQEELRTEIDQVFAVFPAEPAASASIAQVYRAQLRDTGEWVAVKVERPNLREKIDSDLSVLIEVSKVVDRWVPAYHRSMVHQVASEYAARARQEIDFLAEARAIARFAEVLTTQPEFRVPKLRLELCTERLLVMEWFDGVLLDQIEGPSELSALGVSPHFLASAMLRLQLGMSYEHGFVHGDTHPGNIILLKDRQIGLVDFGLHGEVPRRLCDKMLELLFYQSCGRTPDAVSAFLQIFTPNPAVDIQGFEQQLSAILAQSDAPTAGESKITAQLVDGLRLGARYQLRAQSDLFIVLRNLAIVEGIVLTYCPELELVAEVRTILGNILQRRALGVVQHGELSQLLPMALLTLSQRPQLLERLMRLERSFNDARNLGEFLQNEGVFDHQKPERREPFWPLMLMALLGGVVTLLLMRLLAR